MHGTFKTSLFRFGWPQTKLSASFFREEEVETVLGRLQRYRQQYQDIQTDYSKAKMMKKLDPQEENRQLLLAGGDPTRRQRELQVL